MSWLSDLWDDWKVAVAYLACTLIISVSAVFIINVVTDANTADFTRDCLRDHPGSHVDVVSNTGRGLGNIRYCLGPNGETWRVE